MENNSIKDGDIEYIMFKLIKNGDESEFTLSLIDDNNSDFIRYAQFLKNRYDLELEDGEYRFCTNTIGNNKIESMIVIEKSDYVSKNFSNVIEQMKYDLDEELERYRKNEIHIYS